MNESSSVFGCFGAQCGVWVMGEGAGGTAASAVADIERTLLGWHERFSRFIGDSELSRLNRDPRVEVPVSGVMARFVAAALSAAEASGGLVDPTLLYDLEHAGYSRDLSGSPVPLRMALELAPARMPAAASPTASWRDVSVDLDRKVVRRPPGVGLDSGGVAKGFFADVLAGSLRSHLAYAVDCAGDLRIGGLAREVHVASPFDHSTLHTFVVSEMGVATSGIGKRSWLDGDVRPAHHLLDPMTGRPAYTGVVQATALAPSALEAEWRAKAALLSGPAGAPSWLPHGGVLVLDDGTHVVLDPRVDQWYPVRSTSRGGAVR
ncbi:MAG: FAD:protein transferase [Solirubrobacteraceae bacterium]|nr:FAD:protein transferase [Solirubrobacteraceae bacterium]